MLVHVANDDLGGSLDGVIENDIAGGTNPKDDVIGGDFENFVVDGGILPANIVDIGSVTDCVDHVEGFLYDISYRERTGNGSGGVRDAGVLVELDGLCHGVFRDLGELLHGFRRGLARRFGDGVDEFVDRGFIDCNKMDEM